MKDAFKFLLGVAAVVGIIGGILRAFFVTPMQVDHDGMAPTILAGDVVLVWNYPGEPDFGDIAVCGHPTRAGSYVVARYLARQDAEVEADRGQLYINGRTPSHDIYGHDVFTMHGDTHNNRVALANEVFGDWEFRTMFHEDRGVRFRKIVVRNGIFLLGDNRLAHRYDSRALGAIDPTTCVGSVFMRWSTARALFDNAALDSLL